MTTVLRYMLTGTRGGSLRARILRELDEQPRNADRLAEDLDIDEATVRHHLDVLAENGVVETNGDDHGETYLPADRARRDWESIEEILTAAK